MVTTHVLVHGFAGGPWSWESVMADLTEPVRALTMPEERVPTSFPDMVAWLRDAIEGLDIPLSAIHLAGYSSGGRLVAGALADGLAVRCASLISTRLGDLAAAERDERARSDAAWSALLRAQGMRAFLDAWEAQPIFASQRGLAASARQRESRLRLDANALAQTMDAISVARMPDLRGALAVCEVPLQLVAGSLDTKYAGSARDAGFGTPCIIDGAGHNPLLEAPGALARCLTDFARRAPRPLHTEQMLR